MIYKDERGEIIDVAEGEFRAIQVITSKKGSVRSNHWHKKGGHVLFVLSGRMRYLERALGHDYPVTNERVVETGESVFTGPEMIHTCEFLEDSVLICGATLSRADGAYEEDLVRVKGLL